MTDTKHSADLPPLPPHPAAINGLQWSELEQVAIQAYARAAIAAAAPAGEPVVIHFVKSMVHPNGWHECSRYEADGHAKAGHEVRTLYAAPVPAAAGVKP